MFSIQISRLVSTWKIPMIIYEIIQIHSVFSRKLSLYRRHFHMETWSFYSLKFVFRVIKKRIKEIYPLKTNFLRELILIYSQHFVCLTTQPETNQCIELSVSRKTWVRFPVGQKCYILKNLWNSIFQILIPHDFHSHFNSN